jgi:hypothetical protein
MHRLPLAVPNDSPTGVASPGPPVPWESTPFEREERMDSDRHHLLLGWPQDDLQRLIIAALPSRARVTSIDLGGGAGSSLPPLEPIDVAVLRANHTGLGTTPLLYSPALGLSEVVFVIDEAWSPERFALEDRGFQYIVTRSDLIAWLPEALSGLSGIARARRFSRAALANRPTPPPLASPAQRPKTITLHSAETRFRESYLRLLLAEQGSRRRAADHAGVPYRSFCEMLRKLGI